MLISLARTDRTSTFDVVGETNHRPLPDFLVRALATFAQCVRNHMVLMVLIDKRS